MIKLTSLKDEYAYLLTEDYTGLVVRMRALQEVRLVAIRVLNAEDFIFEALCWLEPHYHAASSLVPILEGTGTDVSRDLHTACCHIALWAVTGERDAIKGVVCAGDIHREDAAQHNQH